MLFTAARFSSAIVLNRRTVTTRHPGRVVVRVQVSRSARITPAEVWAFRSDWVRDRCFFGVEDSRRCCGNRNGPERELAGRGIWGMIRRGIGGAPLPPLLPPTPYFPPFNL